MAHNASFGFSVTSVLGMVSATDKVTTDTSDLILNIFKMLTYMERGVCRYDDAKRDYLRWSA